MTTFKERWYQRDAINAFLEFTRTHQPGDNACIVMPTGTGKSIVIARLVEHALGWAENKVMVLTHVGELVRQNVQKFQAICPGASVGVYSATLKHKDTQERVIFGNMQSVCKRLTKDYNAFGSRQLLIIDECHLVPESATSQYRVIIAQLKKACPHLRICGLSATPYRANGGLLTEQDNPVFNHIAYDLTAYFNQLVDEGFLAPLVSPEIGVEINLNNVHVRHGDYVPSELQKAVNLDVLQQACDFTVGAAGERKSWLVFVNSIYNAELVESLLSQRGVNVKAVHSKRPQAENDRAMQAFKQGKLTALVSADQLTTGFDAPQVDLIAMLRPTMSVSLHVQMLGRGTRPAPGKKDCLVLDFAHNTQRLGPINCPYLRDKTPKRKREVAVQERERECPNCGAIVSSKLRYCPACGMYLPELKVNCNNVSDVNLIDDVFQGYVRQKGARLARVSSMVLTPIPTGAESGYIKMELGCVSGVKSFKLYLSFRFDTVSQRSAARMLWGMLRAPGQAPQSFSQAQARMREIRKPDGIEVKLANYVTTRQTLVTRCFYRDMPV